MCDAVIHALEKGPLDPDGLRAAVGKAVRNLGDEGKKKGLTTRFPWLSASGKTAGDIRRVPVAGRLDQQRYKYTLWRPNPLRNFKLYPHEASLHRARAAVLCVDRTRPHRRVSMVLRAGCEGGEGRPGTFEAGADCGG